MRWWYPEDGNRKNLKYTSTDDWQKKTADHEGKTGEELYSSIDWEAATEEDFVEDGRDSSRYFWRRVLTFAVIPLVVGSGWILWVLQKDSAAVIEEVEASVPAVVQSEVPYLGAEEVIRRFMLEKDPFKRLQYVRNPEEVEKHMGYYPKQALVDRAYKIRKLGERLFEGRNMLTYSVGFKDRGQRMLNVLDTDQGPKIDWDSYARYGDLPWEEFLTGEAKAVEMRVVVMPGNYYNDPFSDRGKWTSFRLSNPDLERDLYMYVEKGSLREQGLKLMLESASEYRLHMVLNLRRYDNGAGEKLLTCEKVIAVGWVKGSKDAEDEWKEQVGE